MKKNFMKFRLLDNFDFSHCYKTVVEDNGGGSTETVAETTEVTETAETTETTETAATTEQTEVDKQAEKDKFDADAFRTGKKEKKKKEKVATETTAATTETTETSAEPYKPLPIWDVVKEQLSDETTPYELPEELKTGKTKDGKPLTVKEEFDILRDVITANTDFTDGDSFLEEYLAAKEKGKTSDDFLKSKAIAMNVANMTSEEKAIQSFKEYRDEKTAKFKDKDGKWKEGWTDDDLTDKVESLNPIDLEKMADEYDANINIRKQNQYNKQIKDLNENFDTQYTKTETDNSQQIGNYLKNIEGKTTIAGIEFSEAEITQYRKEIPNFIKRQVKTDEKTGLKYSISPAEELLQSILAKPEDTFELLPYLFMVKNKTLKGYTSRLKENIKKTLDNTLDSKPDTNVGNVGVGGFNAERFRKV